MSETKSPESPSRHDHVDALSDPEAPGLDVQNETLESRARLCFRALSLSLAALVLVLMSLSLHAVIATFVDVARVPSTETLRPLPVSLATDHQEPSEVPPAAQGWPHAIVVVISILMIGEVVLAIGLIRATFSMKVNTDALPVLEKAAPPSPNGLPGIELLKAAAETIETVLKGLPKR